ncbi:MAG TPA: GTP 3',8-cyclase MoaA [Bacteroidia bacterium]|nr:GTP 3',8-cyclase MoaA [Bacteroidia bacterium]
MNGKIREAGQKAEDHSAGPLLDQFGRVHNYLRISLTERCNLRCAYCMPEQGLELKAPSHFMSQDEVIAIASVFVRLGVKKIRLTGGEPLVRKDAAEIIQGLSRLPVEIAVSSNGILIDKYMDVFRRCGIKSLNISLDSLREDRFNTITRRDEFRKVLSNIQLLIDEKFHVKLNAVIMKGVNEDEILDFVEFTRFKPLHYRFIEFMPFNGNKWNWNKGVSFRELLNTLEKAHPGKVQKLVDKANDTSKSFRIAGYLGTFAVISSVTNPFCDTCNRLRLTADGKMKNCLFSGQETDLLGAFRKGEELVELIRSSVWHKKSTRGGMSSFEAFSDSTLNQNNRSMITIGG